MTAIISLFMTYLPVLVKAAGTVPEIIGFIRRTQEILKQDSEWTVEQQMKFDEQVESITSQEHWKTDEERGVSRSFS